MSKSDGSEFGSYPALQTLLRQGGRTTVLAIISLIFQGVAHHPSVPTTRSLVTFTSPWCRHVLGGTRQPWEVVEHPQGDTTLGNVSIPQTRTRDIRSRVPRGGTMSLLTYTVGSPLRPRSFCRTLLTWQALGLQAAPSLKCPQ